MNAAKSNLKELFREFRARNPKPYFRFEALPTSERMSYEMINETNFLEVYDLFKEDENPFISEGYRNLDQFSQYVEYQLNYHRFTPKKAACDWLMRLKKTGQCIGLVNLFDLSRPSFGVDPDSCMIGFCTHHSFRRSYYTYEAVQTLLEYIFENYGVKHVVANSLKQNYASEALLEKLGFVQQTEGFPEMDRLNYFVLSRLPEN